jgi:hypothetical protein
MSIKNRKRHSQRLWLHGLVVLRENVTEIQRSCQFPNIAFDCFGLLKFPGKNLDSSIEFGHLG